MYHTTPTIQLIIINFANEIIVVEKQNCGCLDIYNVREDWSQKYKKSINCNNPKGFSQKAHCAGRKKK